MTPPLTSERIWSRVFATVFAAAFLHELAFSMMINLPGYFAQLGASEGQIGLVFSVAGVASFASRPIVGRWLDLVGRKPIMLVAAAVNGVALLLFLTVDAYGWWMFTTRAIFVVSEIALFTAFLTYAADSLSPERRTQGLAVFGLAGLIPIGAASLLAEVVLDAGGFTALFVTAFGFISGALVLVTRLPRRPRDEGPSLPRRSLWAVLAQRDLVPVWVITFAMALQIDVVFTFMRTFVDETGLGSVGLFFGVYSGCAVAVRLGVSALPDGLGYKRVLVPMFLMLVGAQFLLSTTTTVPSFVTAAALAGTGHGVVFPVLSSETVRRARNAERGSAVAIFTSLFDLALIAAVPGIGRIIDTAGYPAAFRTAGTAILVALIAFLVLDRRVERAPVEAVPR